MQFLLTLTPSFLKRSYARRIFRGWWQLLIAGVLILVAVGGDILSGHFDSLSAFAVTALGLCVLVYGVAWFQQSRALGDWLKQQGGAPVIYTLSEDAVESSSEVGSTKLKWDAFARLTISDLDVLLVFPRTGALTLPTGQVPSEALEFLKQRFLAHGKKVEDRRRQG